MSNILLEIKKELPLKRIKNILDHANALIKEAIEEHLKEANADNFRNREVLIYKEDHQFLFQNEAIFQKKSNLMELVNQYHHIYVLLKAAEILSVKVKPDILWKCHPTQSSKSDDKKGPLEFDLFTVQNDENGYSIEAYGGLDYTNNKKLANDLTNLNNELNSRQKILAFYTNVQAPMWLKTENKRSQNNYCEVSRKFLSEAREDNSSVTLSVLKF